MKVVVIDPGHGGNQKVGGSSPNNAKGANGLLEKDLTLDLATRIRDRLRGQATVILTRTTDTNIGLVERARLAYDNNADVFLSIHFNGFDNTSVDGTEVWIAKNSTGQSQQFAESVLNQVLAVTQVANRGVKQKPANEPDFVVLRPTYHKPNTSAALVEVAFLTNAAQAARLANTSYRDQLATAIATAVQQQIAVLQPQPAAQGVGGQSYGSYGQGYGGYGSAFGEIRPDFSSARTQADVLRILYDAIQRNLRFRQGIDNPTIFPYSSICHFSIRGDDRQTYNGTGFYIAPNRILTAGHNVFDFDAGREWRATSIEIFPGRAHNMSTFGSFSVTPRDWTHHPQWNPRQQRADFDLAVIRVNQAPPHDVFPIEELRMSPQSGIAVCGYAATSDVTLYQQHIDVDTIRDLDAESFTYGLHTRGGTSGSPVFYTDGNHVMTVGVHSRAAGEHLNRGCRLTDSKIRWIRSI